MGKLSILYPWQDRVTYEPMPDESWHDTGMDAICDSLTAIKNEQLMIRQVMINLTDDPDVANFRSDVFADILSHPEMVEKLMKLLDHVKLLNEYGAVHRYSDDTSGVWDLLHRLDEMGDYIRCVEEIHTCLSDETLQSDGLKDLAAEIKKIYEDNGFDALKKDVQALKADTRNLKSATLGINLNERFEAVSFGLVSVNSKPFTRSGILHHFVESFSRRDSINRDSEWDGSMNYMPASIPDAFSSIESNAKHMMARVNPLMAMSLSHVPDGNADAGITRTIENAAGEILSSTCRRLRDMLNRYVTVNIRDIADLIPELTYYVRWAEWIRDKMNKGYYFSRPCVNKEKRSQKDMKAEGFYNLKLVSSEKPENVVVNDLFFDKKNRMYILTGANRGGKTTVTQAVGQLFVMAQGGISVPAKSFVFDPVDRILTHFPADEDKTLDLGRLGEECQRFRSLYAKCTQGSLLLLNETFSTTSFEEGYYIAADAVRAVIQKETRSIYNTHMHKLASECEKLDPEKHRAVSLIVCSADGMRSFRVRIAPPEGMSWAKDIAEKYGVTYEKLTAEAEMKA